ncbi:MAG: DUF3810 domain-containing protein [Planctomycetaceae bacterium]|nr:DUF3810 domain-containing protein [Planctomycetaceae bacterium]
MTAKEAAKEAWSKAGRATGIALAAAGLTGALRWLAGVQPEWTEALYSRGLYPWIRSVQSALSGLSPWSVGELVLVALLTFVLVRGVLLVRALTRRGERRLERLLRDLLGFVRLSSWIWVVYVFTWAFHYARLPYAHGTGLDVRPAEVAELEAAAREWLERTSEWRAKLKEDSSGLVELDTRLESLRLRLTAAYEQAAELESRLAGPSPVLREALASPLMTLGGISGIYWPFTGEPHVNSLPPAPQRLFSALHEVAHERGFAREDEANYIAVRVGSTSGDAELAYSVSLMAYLHLQRSLAAVDAEKATQLSKERPEGVKRDSAAMAEFWKPKTKVAARVREVSTTVNDTYLRAQGQVHGVKSYGRMVDLLLAERRARLAVER